MTVFALTIQTETGPEGHYRLESPGEIQKAAAYLFEHRQHFTGEQQQQYATAVLRQATALDVELGPQHQPLAKLAGWGECTIQDQQQLVEDRYGCLDAGLLQKMAAVTQTKLAGPVRMQLAAALIDMDQEAGLDRRYGRDLLPPEERLFGVTKAAMEAFGEEFLLLEGGVVLPRKELTKLSAEHLRDTLGEEKADAVTTLFGVDLVKLASLLPTLSRSEVRRVILVPRSSA